MNNTETFIAVHAGVGYHSTTKEKDYQIVCRNACLQAMKLLKRGSGAVSVVSQAVAVLEDSPLTNAGVGSNLTLDGSVECDACIMDGQTFTFGAVGCLSNVCNPIRVAESLLQTQLKGNLSLGRTPPSILVGSGAKQWAEEHQIPLTDQRDLITDSSRRTYLKYKKKIERCTHETSPSPHHTTSNSLKPHWKKLRLELPKPSELLEGNSDVQDTVGAVCIDSAGHMAAAASSGGIWMKYPGRLGPAAHFGAGCWAQDNGSTSPHGVAVVTSGNGEQLIKTLLARTCGERVCFRDDAAVAVSSLFTDSFLGSPFLAENDEKQGGVLVLKHSQDVDDSEAELLWAHTTDSMCVGYMAQPMKQPKTFMSRLPPTSIPGKSFTMEGKHFKLRNLIPDTKVK